MQRRNCEINHEAVLGLVRHLDTSSLKELVNNDDAVIDLVKNCEQFKQLDQMKEVIMSENKTLAEYNLSLAPKLEKGKSRLKELYELVQTVWDNVQDKQAQIKSNSGDLSGDTALAILQTAAAESEEESENIAEQFYQKEIEMEKFLELFQISRKQMHLRRVKADKMKDLLLKKQGASSFNGPYKPPPAVPYPIGAINMPYFPMAK